MCAGACCTVVEQRTWSCNMHLPMCQWSLRHASSLLIRHMYHLVGCVERVFDKSIEGAAQSTRAWMKELRMLIACRHERSVTVLYFALALASCSGVLSCANDCVQ